MFFVKDSERTIRIHPSFMGPNIQQYLMAEVVKDTEGTTVDNYYVICILDDYQFSEGKALSGSGHVEYVATYRALCWKPFKNEVVDGVVGNVVDSGFFASVGPLDIFVSRAMIPSDMKFDAQASPPQWTNNEDQVVEKGVNVRIRIRAVKVQIDKLTAIGTINEDYLGPIQGL